MSANDGPVYRGEGKPRDEELVDQLLSQAGARSVNIAAWHAAVVTQSESARVDGTLMEDFKPILNGNCVCLSNFVCAKSDATLFERLKRDLIAHSGDKLKTEKDADGNGSSGLIDWSKHEVYENPTTISATFNAIVELLDHYFDVEVYATRLNYYRDGSTWKPFHHDSHAYGGRALREDFTVGISLGQARELQFLHEPSGRIFSFPQDNGDCFAFTNEVNTKFKHGVPKSADASCKDRFSIIVWGRRRSINERNGGGYAANAALAKRQVDTVDDALEAAYDMVGARASGAPRPADATGDKKKKAKKRLQ